MNQQLRWGVIELVGLHRPNNRNIVGVRGTFCEFPVPIADASRVAQDALAGLLSFCVS